MSHLVPEDMTQIRRLDVNFGREGPSAVDQEEGLAALVTLAQKLARDGDGSSLIGWTSGQVSRYPAWLEQNRPVEASNLPAELGSVIDTGTLSLEVMRRSEGAVGKIDRYGPVISTEIPRRELRRSTFRAQLSRRDRAFIAVMSLCWLASFVNFWIWWLAPAHRISVLGTVLNSLVLAYLTGYPAFYIRSANRMRNVNRSVSIPLLRVAFIVTKAPSEPWDVARATLTAMLNQDFPIPYDVWLADEGPTAEVLRWCNANGVIVSTRNGAQEYHRPTWPRRTKCKEGNLAYFYDHWGYSSYDVVAQLDCDHRPSPTYLAEIVRPFSDPAVGYVAAPSVCDTNADVSWSARGRLYCEASFHGVYQLGHSAGRSPMCIGSHYAVRTSALRDIGGIGPELAEDFTTGFLITTAGWHGAFAIDAEAHGDGPNTFAAMLVQEFQWSKSMHMAMLRLVPRNMFRLPWSLRFRFLYHILFYALLIMSTAGGLLLCLTGATLGETWVHVNYFAFVAHWVPLTFSIMLLTLLLRRRKLMRPGSAPLFSWENSLYTLTRWPYIARGIGSAILQNIHPGNETFRVTPKGTGGLVRLPIGVMMPYLLISYATATAALIGEATNHAAGYIFLCIIVSFLYSAASIVVPILHGSESAVQARAAGNLSVSRGSAIRQTSLLPLILGVLTLLPALYAAVRYPEYLQVVFHLHWRTLFAQWHWGSLFK